jgi:hypothetical protein
MADFDSPFGGMTGRPPFETPTESQVLADPRRHYADGGCVSSEPGFDFTATFGDFDDPEFFTIESPTRVRLGPMAKAVAREAGMSLEEMARHLLEQQRKRELGHTQ